MAARQSREERKQAKELEEARKAGTVAPATDEDGNDISPHIPQYISTTPWYIKQGEGPSLKHQRIQQEEKKSDINKWYTRGAKKGPPPKKYRKGACSNCGAKGHDAKSCLERPRKVGAKFKPVNLAADDVEAPKLNLTYDGARDTWNGYDPNDYQKVIDKYNRLEDERRRIMKETSEKEAKEKSEKKAKDQAKLDIPEGASTSVHKFLADDYEDEEEGDDADLVLKGNEDQVGTKVDGKTRTTIRNLRIREDTAKYLINLDPNSAFYDPKTRSMRGNPLPHKDPSQLDFAGENAVRYSGEAQSFQKLQNYTYEANDKGQPVHMQAAPSQAELLHRDFKKKKENLQQQQQKKILEKYGGEEHLKGPSKALLLGQTESYVEYSQDGKLISGPEINVMSKWEEDIHPGNHSSVWGSFWFNGKWGYSCCYQLEKNAYCLGDAGKEAHRISQKARLERVQNMNQIKLDAIEKRNSSISKSKTPEEEEREKKLKLQAALAAEEERLRAPSKTDRDRSFNSFDSCEVSDEQMEAYHLKRARTEDPMADYMAAKRHRAR